MPRPLPALLFLLAALSGGCGERVVGGGGGLDPEPAAGPVRLEVHGDPYQMGWWQGRLLRDRIRAFHPRAQREAFGGGERADTLRSACLLYVDQTLRRLPEALRQELQGLAEGSGVAAEDLLLTEVLRDGLRYHQMPRRLEGSLVWDGSGPRLACRPAGPDGAVLADRGVIVSRRPAGGRPTALLTWPGSLGGVAGFAETGLAAVMVETDLPLDRQTLSEVPTTVRLRRALERAETPRELVERLGDSTAHRVLVADGRTFEPGPSPGDEGGGVVFALTGIAATEVACVSDMAEAGWAADADEPGGWSPAGVWLGPPREPAAGEAAPPPPGPSWSVGWEDGRWDLRVDRGAAPAAD